MTVRSAIAMSSDIFFYVVGGGLASSHVDGLGVDRLAANYRKFHLGQISGIDIPGEKAGLVPDPAWKLDFYRDNAVLGKWYLGDTYHISIGQGDVLVTPLQVALWTATIANNGVGMKPRIVSEIHDSQGGLVKKFAPEVLIPKVATDANIKVVQEGMRQAVLTGTAKRLLSLPITSAGKTGTAQFDNNEKEHSWFTSFAPYEDPQIVVTVLVEGGGEGGAAALPISQGALAWWAQNRYTKK
jgi:penicillin-binding protein 2